MVGAAVDLGGGRLTDDALVLNKWTFPAQPLAAGTEADRPDLADPDSGRRTAKWQAVEKLRERFGAAAVISGRGLGGRK